MKDMRLAGDCQGMRFSIFPITKLDLNLGWQIDTCMMSSRHLVDLFDEFTVICRQYITLGYSKYNLCLYLSKCV